jgi:hypothetical protein
MTRAALHMGPPICAPADRARYTPLRVAFPRRRAERAIDQQARKPMYYKGNCLRLAAHC